MGWALPDGCVRLAREVPYGSATWKKRYGRRSLSESRNGSLKSLGLKRLPSFSLARGFKEVAISPAPISAPQTRPQTPRPHLQRLPEPNRCPLTGYLLRAGHPQTG